MGAAATPPALSYRCSPWTRGQDADPVGSALTCDTMVLIEMPPPWPRDIGDSPAFAALQRLGLLRTRLLAVRPGAEPGGQGAPGSPPAAGSLPAAGPGGVRVTIWRRAAPGQFAGTDHLVPAGDHRDAGTALAGAVAALLEAPQADAGGRPAPAEVLLCGHGSRDRCCGRLGTRLAQDVAGAWPGVRVRRCSHTGGHRFAPTGFTLPDGRAWGFLDAAILDGIVRRSGPPPLRGHYRGSTALDAWGQVAERELFERFGWAWLDCQLTSARTQTAPDGRSASVELSWLGPGGPATAMATVGVVRDIPVLVCGQPPERAEKSGPELALESISIS